MTTTLLACLLAGVLGSWLSWNRARARYQRDETLVRIDERQRIHDHLRLRAYCLRRSGVPDSEPFTAGMDLAAEAARTGEASKDPPFVLPADALLDADC